MSRDKELDGVLKSGRESRRVETCTQPSEKLSQCLAVLGQGGGLDVVKDEVGETSGGACWDCECSERLFAGVEPMR